MSSPSLPSPASLQPLSRPHGFVTARSILDLDTATSEKAVIPAPLPSKDSDGTIEAHNAPLTKSPPRSATAVDGNAGNEASSKIKARKMKTSVKTAKESTGDESSGVKRGRPRKTPASNVAPDDTADGATTSKPVPKRGRKKAVENGVEKPKLPPKPRKSRAVAATKAKPSPKDAILPSEQGPVEAAVAAEVEAQLAVTSVTSGESLDLDPASKRRRDWTPPTETALPPSFQRSSDASPHPESGLVDPSVNHEAVDDVPTTTSFTNLMGDFGYQQEILPPPLVSKDSNEAPTTKRKRLNHVDITAAEESQKRKKKEPEAKPKQPKKPRAPKKKPTTITALATAAYRQPGDETDHGKSISEFFKEPQPDSGSAVADESVPSIPKQSAKRQTAEDKPAPKRKRTKKVQIAAPEISVKLDAPDVALENMKNQQWLFGSSSQLAAAESPTEFRDLQQALKESEDMISSQHIDPLQAKSCARVPSAPHGTSLSIGQANRILWMSAARDFEDSTFASDEGVDNRNQESMSDATQVPEGDIVQAQVDTLVQAVPEAEFKAEITTISSSATKQAETPDSGYVDIDQFDVDGPHERTVGQVQAQQSANELPNAALPISNVGKHEVAAWRTSSNTECGSRQALTARDPNISLPKPTVNDDSKEFAIPDLKIVRPTDPPVKRSRGRPPKVLVDKELPKPLISSDQVASQSPVKSKGRPRKASVNTAPHSPSKPRGRPPKLDARPRSRSPVSAKGLSRKTMSPSALPTSSQLDRLPLVRARTPPQAVAVDNSSDYLDIDAISDAEIAIHTPSPPRRLPDSPPKATLEFDRPPPVATALVSAAPSTAKQIQAEWSNICSSLFPQIMQTIVSTPPSRDHKAPTWHEKILLYDPIVLEDLTAWLNGQGLRIEVMRSKSKGKKKASETEELTEVVREELQPWMVQKWCEEHSVCCLWKEGLRGGVRQRY